MLVGDVAWSLRRTHHQEVGFGPLAIGLSHKDAAGAEVFGEGNAKVGVVEDAEVVRLGGIGGAHLAGLDFQLGLAETPSLYKRLVCEVVDG